MIASEKWVLLSLALIQWFTTFSFAIAESVDLTKGHLHCPCLSSEDVSPAVFINTTHLDTSIIRFESYGLNTCEPFDRNTSVCNEECPDLTRTLDPSQPFCDRSWCGRSWCYVDPHNCHLDHHKSSSLEHRYYSYATCGEADSYTGLSRLEALNGKTLRVTLLRNSGGWRGAYSETGKHHDGPWSIWSGLAVEFMIEASKQAGFKMEITEPPDFISNSTKDAIGSSSTFNTCVHATSLGFVDVCIAQSSITIPRALNAHFVDLDSEVVYLIVKKESAENDSNFLLKWKRIFAPFATQTWLFILVFVIPIFGITTVVHEWGNPSFPRTETIFVVDDETGEQVQQDDHKIPLFRHIFRSIYFTLLATLRGDYDVSVISCGAKVNTIGISFFIGKSTRNERVQSVFYCRTVQDTQLWLISFLSFQLLSLRHTRRISLPFSQSEQSRNQSITSMMLLL